VHRSNIFISFILYLITVSCAYAAESYGPTQPGDMMWKIATQVRPNDSVSRYQVMLALLRSNPHAFDIPCNLNSLKVGETLKIPPMAQMKALSERAAVEEYKQQVEAWKNRRNNPINCPPITADVETEKALEAEAKTEAESQKVATTSRHTEKEEQNQKTTTETPEEQEKTEPVEATSPAPATEETTTVEAQQQTQKDIKIPPPSVSALVDSGEVSESEGSEAAPVTTELSTESSEASPPEAEMTQPPATETEPQSNDAAESSDAPLTETADEPVALVRDTPPAPEVIDTEQQETAVARTDSPPSEGLMASTVDEMKRVILELPQTVLILLGVGLLISIIIISILLYMNRRGGRNTTADSEPIQEMPLHPGHKTE